MKLRDKVVIAIVLIAAFGTSMFLTRPLEMQAASDYVNTWLRTNVTNSSDGVSLLVEYTPNSSLTGDFATTNTVEDILDVERTSSGSPSAGIGTGVTLSAETAAGNVELGLSLDAVTTDVTSASEDFDFVVGLMDGGAAAAERWRTDSGGVITQSAVSAATNAVIDVMNIKHNTSGTEANGIGLGILFTQEVTSGDEIAASIDVSASDVTGASEDFSYILSLMSGGGAASAVWTMGSTGIETLVGGTTRDNATSGTDYNITETTITLTASGGVTASADLTATDDMIVGGWFTVPTTTVSTLSYTIGASGKASAYIVEYTDTAAAAIYLPDTPADGTVIWIKDGDLNASANNVTVGTEGSDTIEEAATFVMNANGESAMFLYDTGGTDWNIMGGYLE